ncbi:MAG TPA: hypothetical protein VHY35_09750 [Stellaceae bacterium]|nr:hypothetical protein [Stellaceae bacterium]
MKLFQYLDRDGNFNYEKYRSVQEDGNKAKIKNRWTNKNNINLVASYLRRYANPLNFGICHGTRQGHEQLWFREALNIEVIGTEISETATEFPYTIRWDFHEINVAWLDKVDFIYSNSFDHAYDPEKCFRAWWQTLRRGGFCILEHTKMHTPAGVSQLDPFGIEREELTVFLENLKGARFIIRDVISDFPFVPEPHMKELAFIIAEKPAIP